MELRMPNFHSKTYICILDCEICARTPPVCKHLCARKNKREVNIRIACVSTIGMDYYEYVHMCECVCVRCVCSDIRILDSSSERLLLRLTYTMNRAFAFIYDQFRFPYIILCHTIGMSHVAQLHNINVFNTLRRLMAGNHRLAHTHTLAHLHTTHRHLEAKNKGSAKRNKSETGVWRA